MVDMTQEQTEPAPDAGFDPQRLRTAPLQMRRSRTDRHIAGVCGGFADYARIDPVVVRVVIAALAVTGAGLVIYLAAWILVPEEGSDIAAVDTRHRSNTEDVRRIGWILAGILAFGALISAGPWFDVWFPWPVVALGVLAWFWFARDRGAGVPTDATTSAAAYVTSPAYAGAPEQSGAEPPYAGSSAFAGVAPPPPAPPRRTRPNRGDGSLWFLTTGTALVVLGILWAVDRSGGDLDPAVYPATALAIVGAGMVAGAVIGNGRRLTPLAVLLGLALLVTSQVSVWRAGEIEQTPQEAADVMSSYELGAGRVWLDLTEIRDLEALDGRTLDIEVTAGEIVVLVPDGLDVTVNASQATGEIRVLGERDEGFRNDVDVSPPDTGAPDLHLVLDGFAGRMEVTRA
jgi:phage shock protein PspC (stress-responsive transcriptional regulator)